MALVPEYKYTSGPGYFKVDGGKILAGYETGAVFLFREIIDIDASGFTVNNQANNPYKLWERKLPNGVVLKLFCHWSSTQVYGYFKAYYNNVEFTTSQYTASGLNTGASGELNDGMLISPNSFYATDFVTDRPWKLVVNAFYPNGAIENITPATGFGFHLFIPTFKTYEISMVPTSVYNELNSLTTNMILTFANISTITIDGNDYRVDPAGNGWSFYNLETTNNFMKTAGDGMPDNLVDGNNTDPPLPEDDTSGTGGGGGSYDPTSDPIDFPSLPTGGAMTSGMLKGFVIGTASLIQIQNKLWDMSIFDITTQFQKLVNQPLDCLISLHCLPALPDTATNPENVKLGSFDTGVTALRITNQYKAVSGGSLTVPKYWGSALDYAPFTRVEIYLPFIGIRNLEIEDIQGQTITVKYHVDVLTGDCVAYIKCGSSVLYSFTGNCLTHIPVTAQSSDLLAKNISAVGMFGVGVATGNPASAIAGAAAGAINSATAKNHVQRSGDVAGSPGIMSEFTPYLIFHRPKQSLAKNYNIFKGYPSNITYTLSSLTGYTEVEHVHLTGISGATDAELQEIERLLKEGVII